MTITRSSDNHVLATDTTLVSSASAPPFPGSSWVQIKRTGHRRGDGLPLPGASVNITGGPDTTPLNRTDTADVRRCRALPGAHRRRRERHAGLHAGDDARRLQRLSPTTSRRGRPSSIASTPGLNSTGTIRMYKGTSLTVNVQSVGRRGVHERGDHLARLVAVRQEQTVSIPNGQSSVPFTACDYRSMRSQHADSAERARPDAARRQVLRDRLVDHNRTGNWSTGTRRDRSLELPDDADAEREREVRGRDVPTRRPSSLQKHDRGDRDQGRLNDTNARVEMTGAPTGLGGPSRLRHDERKRPGDLHGSGRRRGDDRSR